MGYYFIIQSDHLEGKISAEDSFEVVKKLSFRKNI